MKVKFTQRGSVPSFHPSRRSYVDPLNAIKMASATRLGLPVKSLTKGPCKISQIHFVALDYNRWQCALVRWYTLTCVDMTLAVWKSKKCKTSTAIWCYVFDVSMTTNVSLICAIDFTRRFSNSTAKYKHNEIRKGKERRAHWSRTNKDDS